MSTLLRYKTALIFWIAVLFSVVSLGLIYVEELLAAACILLSVLFNVWSLWKSDREGFVKSKELRRAYEPARRFGVVQTLVLLGFVMGQIGAGTYVLLATSTA